MPAFLNSQTLTSQKCITTKLCYHKNDCSTQCVKGKKRIIGDVVILHIMRENVIVGNSALLTIVRTIASIGNSFCYPGFYDIFDVDTQLNFSLLQ